MLASYKDSAYVSAYNGLYIHDSFWQAKYRYNATVIQGLLESLRPQVWVDLCCGQGQYFALAAGRGAVRCVGVDASEEQVARARAQGVVGTEFLVADVLDQHLVARTDRADFITLMWGAYCYLGGREEIGALLANVAKILRPGGAFLFEVVEPTTLLNFNTTEFARRSGARVKDVSGDGDGGLRWVYEDSGGEHHLYSPTLDWMLASMAYAGIAGKSVATVQTLHQVVGYRSRSI